MSASRKKRPTQQDRPHVALMVETSKGYGRGILRGIRQYVNTYAAWNVYVDERALADPLPKWVRQGQADGLILRSERASVVAQAKELRTPTVYLGEVDDTFFPQVTAQQESVAQQAAEHLSSRGFDRVGYVGLGHRHWSRTRRNVLQQWCEQRQIPCEVIELGTHHHQAARQLAPSVRLSDWLERLDKPIGIMACNDWVGTRVIEACRNRGIAVPESVAVVGVDDDPLLCEFAQPPLSSVAQDLTRMGFEGAVMLAGLMESGQKRAEHVKVPALGVTARLSTDIVAIEDALVAEALRLIREQAADGLQVQDLVRQLPTNRNTLNKRFRTWLGRTVKDEIARLRVDQCCLLLRRTSLPLNEIAEQAGFQRPQHMSLAFKRLTGVSPSEYRCQHRIDAGGD